MLTVSGSDTHHTAAVSLSRQFQADKLAPFISNYFQVECHALFLARLGRFAARSWLLTHDLHIVRATLDDEAAARQLLATHRDKGWSFCGALSFVRVERLKAAAFSFDHHFRQYGRIKVWGR